MPHNSHAWETCWLLARGLMKYNTNWKEIQKIFLPCKSAHQIFVRQKNRSCSRAPENPIKENILEIRRQTASAENPPSDLDIMQLVLGKRSAYIRGWSRVPSTRSSCMSSGYGTGSSGRATYAEISARLVATEAKLASTKSDLATTKSDLEQLKDGMTEMCQLLRSILSAKSLPNFSAESLNVPEHGSET